MYFIIGYNGNIPIEQLFTNDIDTAYKTCAQYALFCETVKLYKGNLIDIWECDF